MTASTVPQPVSNVDILVGGLPSAGICTTGVWYVEAFKGRDYAIRLRPIPMASAWPWRCRLTVLNTIDARHTTASDARKCGARSEYDRHDQRNGRRAGPRLAVSNSRPRSNPTRQALGRGANLGVISAVFFRERVLTTRSETASTTRGVVRRHRCGAGTACRGKRAQEADARSRDSEYAATGIGRPTDQR